MYIYINIFARKKPAKMAENDLVSRGHGQACSLGGPWTGWIGSAPVQISGYGLDRALSWWCDELLLVVVVLRLSVVPRGRAIGVLATKGIPLQIAADREKGRASWRQVRLHAQSLLHRRFRRALRAFICTFCMRVCIYVYVCMCADMYIYIYMCMCVCICICMRLYTMRFYTCVSAGVCIFVHRLWVSVSVLQHVDGAMHAHVCVGIHIYPHTHVHFFAVSVACTLEQVFWALVHGQVCMW